MHPIVAIRAFFAALFGGTLPEEVIPAGLLPAPAPDVAPTTLPTPVQEPDKTPDPEPVPEPAAVQAAPNLEGAAAQALGVLQNGGRLLDFLSEDIEDYEDADIGAAVREVHRGCRKALDEHFDLEPVHSAEEEDMVTVAEGFDPNEVRLVGNIIGKPPFSGTLKHKGWRAKAVRLPRVPEGDAGLIIAPAEVEV